MEDDMDKEILTIEEAAAYLQIGKRSLYKLAKKGSIPRRKVLNKWRFEKESLRKWVSEHTTSAY
ncbi:MAG: helix-turn-helix domain-containing protein [Desulfobacteraceae bacterium]|nr:helix-turn-helix domain-containing protein [Desulfobacteraceae bacterium]